MRSCLDVACFVSITKTPESADRLPLLHWLWISIAFKFSVDAYELAIEWVLGGFSVVLSVAAVVPSS